MPLRAILYESRESMRGVYFPNNAIISLQYFSENSVEPLWIQPNARCVLRTLTRGLRARLVSRFHRSKRTAFISSFGIYSINSPFAILRHAVTPLRFEQLQISHSFGNLGLVSPKTKPANCYLESGKWPPTEAVQDQWSICENVQVASSRRNDSHQQNAWHSGRQLQSKNLWPLGLFRG